MGGLSLVFFLSHSYGKGLNNYSDYVALDDLIKTVVAVSRVAENPCIAGVKVLVWGNVSLYQCEECVTVSRELTIFSNLTGGQ